MMTIPIGVLIGVLIFAIVVAAAMGAWVSSLQAAGQAKRWQAVRDDLREQRDDFRERLDEAVRGATKLREGMRRLTGDDVGEEELRITRKDPHA